MRIRYTVIALLCASALAQPHAITTKSYDNARTGTQTHETVLTQDAIAKHGLVLQTTIPVYGDARGMEASMLVQPYVQTKTELWGGPKCDPRYACVAVAVLLEPAEYHDVMVLPSMANVVRGVDAETGAGLWQTTLGVPVQGPGKTPQNPNGIDFHSINDKWGCLSTGVIVGTRWYGVCQVSIDGSGNPATGRYFMFGLNLADGSQAFKPVPVQGTDTSLWKQRSALTYLPKANVIAFAHGSVYEMSNGYTGGVTVFDLATNTVSAQLPLTSGIWMAGQGLVADADENMYAITGNGAFDPSKGWYGESFIKMRYWPYHFQSTLALIDQWAPWTDMQRAALTGCCASDEALNNFPRTPPKLAGQSRPSEAVKPVGSGMSMPMSDARVEAAINAQGQVVARVYPTMARGEWSDEDWGSAGPACIFEVGVCVATGKDGIGYPIKTSNIGGTMAQTVGTAGNYQRLASTCAWLTMSPGNVPCDPADPRALNFFPNGVTAHLHMTPVQMYDPLLKSWVLFVWGENAQLHKWAVGPTGKMTYIAESNEYASANLRSRPPGGMAGGFCSGSSNGNDVNSALLVCVIPYSDVNAGISNGRMLVYDPYHLAADGSLKVLWDSERWAVQFTANKFMTPTIWNGRIYYPDYSGRVLMFALGK